MVTKRVAVYGTLREGCGNWSHLLNRKPVEVTRLPNFKMYSLGGFPGIVPSEKPEDEITVEIYEVNDEDLLRLDRLEGYREDNLEFSMYRRERVEEIDSDIYIWNRGRLSEDNYIQSGDWKTEQERRY